ncbi:MAG: hypothetical protein GY858_10005, partial [Candidatus Omnitrophica bacterium]|nr:hypothetical protein [Candidatus Omnitrophota bacterium]
MKKKAEAVQAQVVDVANLDEAFRYAVDLTRRMEGASMAAAGWNGSDRAALKNLVEAAGLRFIEPPLREHADDIHTAFTPTDFGIAETGSLVLDSTSEDVRVATMLSEVHVAVLPVLEPGVALRAQVRVSTGGSEIGRSSVLRFTTGERPV